MDLYSSSAGFIEVIASAGEIIVDDNLFGEHPWLDEDTENVHVIVSAHGGQASFMQMLRNPINSGVLDDRFYESRPLLAVCGDSSWEDNSSKQISSDNPETVAIPMNVYVYLLKSQSYVHTLKFWSTIYAVRCSSRIVAVLLAAQIHCFDHATLELNLIQDISFSNDSNLIVVSSSRGTSHLFEINPEKEGDSPVPLSAINRIGSGWIGTVSDAASAAAGIVGGSVPGTVTSTFCYCVEKSNKSHDIDTIEHLFLDLPDRFGASIEILFGSLVIQKKQIPVNESTSQKLSLVCNLLLLLFPAQALHLVGYCSVVARRCVHPRNPVLLLVLDGTNITLFFLLPCYILLLGNLLNFKEMTSRCVPRQGELTVIIMDWLFKRHLALLLHLPFAQVYDSVSLLYKEEDKLVVVTLYGHSKVAAVLLTKDDLALLLHGTGHFVGQELVDDFDRLCTFIFGSLTRPPEAHCVCFKPLPYFIGFGYRLMRNTFSLLIKHEQQGS